jgi:hypothetical protein
MTNSNNIETPAVNEVCARIRTLGFAAPGRVRLYGQEFEVVSDPFPQDDGIAVQAKPVRAGDERTRVVQLPATIIQSAKGRAGKAA